MKVEGSLLPGFHIRLSHSRLLYRLSRTHFLPEQGILAFYSDRGQSMRVRGRGVRKIERRWPFLVHLSARASSTSTLRQAQRVVD